MMARRKEILNIAHGLLGSFISRNNDINGYWALGLLYKHVLENEADTITLDIFDRKENLRPPLPLQISSNYRRLLLRMCTARQIPPSWIKKAVIEIAFDIADPVDRRIWQTSYGEPFSVDVFITDDRGKKYLSHAKGRCKPHDPARELRSLRAKSASTVQN